MSQMVNTALLLALLLAGVLAEEHPKPIFRALGGELEMGFCFGDYIAVYRITAGGRELLGESSEPVSSPEAFKGRINITGQKEGLLGLKILNLQFSDSGVYSRGCKRGDNLEKHLTHLYVCGKEIDQQDISLTTGTGANLACDDSAREASNSTVKWYRDVQNASLFLDTKISLEPLQVDFKGHVQVKDKGSLLHVSDDFIKDRPNFFCLVMNGEQCLSFQTILLPDEPDIKSIYRSVGESLALTCSVDHLRQNYWETPFGPVISSKPVSFKETTGSQIFASNDLKTGHYSLVLPSLTLNHTGNYKCYSTILVEDYIVNVCPVHASSNVSFTTEDKKASLTCRYISELELSENADLVSILWLRKSDGEDVLIIDSGDPSLPMPKDLEGRVSYSKEDVSLVITNPNKGDSGTYWCVVLREYNSYTTPENNDNNIEASTDQDEDIEWLTEEDMNLCIYRQVTNLRFQSDAKSNLTIYAVCGGVIALLALIGIAVVIRMRAKKNSVI